MNILTVIYDLKKENNLFLLPMLVHDFDFDFNKVSNDDADELFLILYRQFEFELIVDIYRKKFKNLTPYIVKVYIKSIFSIGGMSLLCESINDLSYVEKYHALKLHPDLKENINVFDSFILYIIGLSYRNEPKNIPEKNINTLISELERGKLSLSEARKLITQVFIQDINNVEIVKNKIIAIRNENHDFKYVGSTGIGNSVLMPLFLSKKDYSSAHKEVRNIDLSLLLTYKIKSDSREPININKEYKNVLIISHQGVGDEVRNFGFYHYIKSESISIVSDPRFLPLLADENYHLIPFTQSRPGFYNDPNAKTLLDRVMPKSVISDLNSYDLVMTTTEFLYGLKSQVSNPNRKLINLNKKINVKHQKNKKRIGIIWRSDFINKKRMRHFIDLSFFEELFINLDAEFVPLVNHISSAEIEILKKHNIKIPSNISNSYDDFIVNSQLLSSLDMVIGISSFSLELASAIGRDTFVLCPTADGFYTRSGIDATLGAVNDDYMTLGSKTISANNYRQSRKNVRIELIDNLLKALKYENF